MMNAFPRARRCAPRCIRFLGGSIVLMHVIAALHQSATNALAQPNQPTHLRVATRVIKPFVLEENGRLTGFSIELWHEIGKQMEVESTFVVKPTVKELLASIKDGQADVGIAAISITAERELVWDFSHPMFDAGLQILVANRESQEGLLGSIIGGVFSSAVLPILGIVLLIILIPAHLVWFFERRNPTGMLSDKSYLPGIFEACWWAASTLATQADQMPRAALARVVAVVWMFTSVVFIAYFTAAVTSSLTVKQLRGEINGPQDLPGKRVASVKSSTSVEYLRQHNADVTEFEMIEDVYEALLHGQVDAVVYDAPVLLHYASREGTGKVHTVGPIFRKESYGIAFPANSRNRKRVNEALLKLKENGTYDQLHQKWFGSTES
jgi:polar amino acid transport system substrate-binding protein